MSSWTYSFKIFLSLLGSTTKNIFHTHTHIHTHKERLLFIQTGSLKCLSVNPRDGMEELGKFSLQFSKILNILFSNLPLLSGEGLPHGII